jgi:6-phosphogluconolactonase (cycloisomerase 2 family)
LSRYIIEFLALFSIIFSFQPIVTIRNIQGLGEIRMNMPTSLPVRVISLLSALGALAACGGDGSSNSGPPPTPHTIGGSVAGLKGSRLALQDNGGDTLAVSGNGNFTFSTSIANGDPFNVTVSTQPANPSQTCTVAHGSGTVSGDDITNVAVSCATNSYTVGGMVSGLSGSGLILANNGTNDTPVSKNGTFSFSTEIPRGNPYSVTVAAQPTNPPQNCTVANPSGTVAGSNISLSVTCATDTYSAIAYVSGLAGSGLTLSYNGGAPIAVSRNGAFTAASGLAIGTAYSVAVVGQPTNPAQTCVLSNGSGAVATANVTSIMVFCPQAVGQFAYIVNTGFPSSANQTLGTISVYRINSTSGALTLVSGSSVPTGPSAQALQFIPHTSFAWSLNVAAEYALTAPFQLSVVYDYSVNPTTGLLTAVSGSPFAELDGTTSTPGCGQNGPSGLGESLWITFDPNETFGYVSNGVNPNQDPPQENGQIWQFTVDPATGAPGLVPNGGLAGTCGEDPPPVVIDPSGQFAYIGGDDLLAFTINSQTGTLTPVPGSPYNVAGNVVTDPAGRFVYAMPGTGISAFTISPSNGALTPVVGSPFAIDYGSLVVSPDGQFAYVIKSLEASEGGGIYLYSISTTGALTAVATSPVSLGYPKSFTIDPSGQFAYAVAYIGTSGVDFGVYAFTINPTTGALLPVSGNPFAASSPPGYTTAITVTN